MPISRRAGARYAGVVRAPVVLSARCAGVVRAPVVLSARYGQRDSRCAWYQIETRCAACDPRCAWFRSNARYAGVVPFWCGGQILVAAGRIATGVAEHAAVADRFAHEISAILAGISSARGG